MYEVIVGWHYQSGGTFPTVAAAVAWATANVMPDEPWGIAKDGVLLPRQKGERACF